MAERVFPPRKIFRANQVQKRLKSERIPLGNKPPALITRYPTNPPSNLFLSPPPVIHQQTKLMASERKSKGDPKKNLKTQTINGSVWLDAVSQLEREYPECSFGLYFLPIHRK